MPAEHEFDLAVIGSGGGAFAAAIRATNLGKRVVMIERGTIGGTCVNTGCVPSKALLAAAAARHGALDSRRFPGITTGAEPVDMAALIAGKGSLVAELQSSKYEDLIGRYGWAVRRGSASFAGSAKDPVLMISGSGGGSRTLRAEHYLVATGSTPFIPEIEGLANIDHLTSTSAMELDHVPDTLVILGGGYVALEQAQLFARLGTEVTVLVRSRLASAEEPEASKALMGVFADEGIRVIRRAKVESVRSSSGRGVIVRAVSSAGRDEYAADHLLVATGRAPVTVGLNLTTVGVETGINGEVVVDDRLATSNPRVWAAGDVTGHPAFVYVAAAHGAIAVDNMFSSADREVNYRSLPRVMFTSPNLAAVGLTDKQARESGIDCECRVVTLNHIPRALVNRDTRGFIKIVADQESGRIVGITAVAENAAEIAAAGVYILEAGMTVPQVANMWSPYLAMAEAIKLAAQSFTRDVSQLSCCAA